MTGPVEKGRASSGSGTAYEVYDSIGSTNTEALKRAREGWRDPVWISALEQTSGRGRRGREWASSRGNLFASRLICDPPQRDRISELPLVGAVALSETLEALTGSIGLIKLKWPNDLLLGGAKLSGILVEAESLPGDRLSVVCGFGVNCAVHPNGGLYPCTDLAAAGYQVRADVLFQRLMSVFDEALIQWAAPGGFETTRRAWLSRAAHVGQQVNVRNGAVECTGRFHDLDAAGQLILKRDDGGLETVSSGDVFLSNEN